MDETYAKGINNPKNIEVKKLTNETVSNFKKEIENSDVYNKLDKHMSADPNSNFNILSKILNTAKLGTYLNRLRSLTNVNTRKKNA